MGRLHPKPVGTHLFRNTKMTATHVYSMTGFGTGSINLPQCQLNLQLKSVNSRYLDLSFKIPEELAPHEAILRDTIAQRIKRGKIECKITWQAHVSTTNSAEINIEALQNALNMQNLILQHASTATAMTVAELLQQPGVVPSSAGASSVFTDTTAVEIEQLAIAAINAFLDSRAAEGAHLAQTLNDRLAAITAIVDDLRIKLPELLAHQEAKLAERLFKAVDASKNDVSIATSAIPREELIERIRQEASMTAIRIDVAEELDRLDGHIANTRNILKNGATTGIGKKLDFLMQEFNREANTLGSKSASLLQTEASMNLKLIIEQMREQVQNIE